LSDFWARASIGMAPNSGAYGQIVSTREDRLISARTPAAAIVEIHEHIKDQGVMRMREVPGGLQIPANQPVLMAPGGYHIMLINVTSPLQADSTIPLTLEFEQAGTVELTVPVRGIMQSHQGTHGGMKGHGH
ncbi:MAG: copper chaperone PCu(A)C, partial [Gammaproteobacteria bacterium]|nr:copper chaperone PCu(A)C [Gammaproteobacteria bacterium]